MASDVIVHYRPFSCRGGEFQPGGGGSSWIMVSCGRCPFPPPYRSDLPQCPNMLLRLVLKKTHSSIWSLPKEQETSINVGRLPGKIMGKNIPLMVISTEIPPLHSLWNRINPTTSLLMPSHPHSRARLTWGVCMGDVKQRRTHDLLMTPPSKHPLAQYPGPFFIVHDTTLLPFAPPFHTNTPPTPSSQPYTPPLAYGDL